jgi:CheY-like chemotaxis protein
VNNENYSLLVVDDEPSVLRVVVTVLACDFACKIHTATCGDDALAILRDNNIAVLLTDFQMPGMGGLDLAKTVHQRSPDTVCILITAFATKELMITTLNDGHIWRCLEKPWQADKLIELTKEAVSIYLDPARSPGGIRNSPLATVHDVPERDTSRKKKEEPQKQLIVVKKHKRRARSRKASGKGHIRFKRREQSTEEQPESSLPAVDERYTNLQPIRKGGSGEVYKAMDVLLNMPVAIKVLSAQTANEAAVVTELFNEARIAMQLTHKHIVRLHNINKTKRGLCYLVMEYIDGCTFRELLEQEGPLPKDMVVNIVTICEDALGYAHRRQIYHRDLKPSNLMLSEDGLLKIIDLGLACLSMKARTEDVACGTPYYISPEEVGGKPVDQRTDIYSLGIMIHEFLTGVLPFVEGMADVDSLSFLPMASSDLPEPVRKVLQQCFAVDPDDRWVTVHDFANAFRAASAE